MACLGSGIHQANFIYIAHPGCWNCNLSLKLTINVCNSIIFQADSQVEILTRSKETLRR